MRLSFREQQLYLDWRWRKFPLLRVTLAYAGVETVTFGLLDSGADACLFHASIAEDLGIDVRWEGRRARGHSW